MLKIICFHNPDEENGYLSNWYLSVFTYGGTEYSSMEQYMMHRKAICLSDRKIADAIMETDDVAEKKNWDVLSIITTINKRKIRKRSKIRVSETKTRPEISVIGVKTRPDIFDNGFKLDRKYPKTI